MKHQRVVTNNVLKYKKKKQQSFLFKYLNLFCNTTTVHGIKYLCQPGLHWTERLAWTVFVASAFLGAIYVSLLLSEQYNTSPLSTVVESTYYHVSEIPYPGVTICNNNRINYKKVDAAIQRFIPNASISSVETFKLLVQSFQTIDFGSFEVLEPILRLNVTELLDLSLSKMGHECEELFDTCWWRNRYFNCCEIFGRQKSEYGICFGFNSFSSLKPKAVNRSAGNWPWRASDFKDWSGLRVVFNTLFDKKSIENNVPNGAKVIVHDPFEWPNSAHFIPAGSSSSIVIRPAAYITSDDVTRLTPQQRQCVYEEDTKQSWKNIMKLDKLPYQRANCMSECRQRYMQMYCNCTLDFFYPNGVYPACNITGLLCMNLFNDIFNYEKPPVNTKYFDSNEKGLTCSCLPECTRINYGTEVQPKLESAEKDSVILDIHYSDRVMVKYRTDIKFGWLDLLVGFGGVAGLFLGCSILSGVECFYCLTFGLCWELYRHSSFRKHLKSAMHPVNIWKARVITNKFVVKK